jgi:hypothetical protein
MIVQNSFTPITLGQSKPDKQMTQQQSFETFLASLTVKVPSWESRERWQRMGTYAKGRILARRQLATSNTENSDTEVVDRVVDELMEMHSPGFEEDWHAHELALRQEALLKVKSKAQEMLAHYKSRCRVDDKPIPKTVLPGARERSSHLYYIELTDNYKFIPIEPWVMRQISQKMDDEQLHPDALSTIPATPARRRKKGLFTTVRNLLAAYFQDFPSTVKESDFLSMREVCSAVLDFTKLLSPLDAGDRNGLVHGTIIDPLNVAAANENRLLDLAKALAAKRKRLRSLNERVPNVNELADFRTGIPFQLRRKDLIAIALNVGDEGRNSNFQTLLEGYKWMADDVIAALDNNLTEQEWLFVSDVYGVYSHLLPEVEDHYRDLTGLEFERPDERPFKPRPFDMTIGGYYPQMYDLTRCKLTNRDGPFVGYDVSITPPYQWGIDRRSEKIIRINFDLIVPTLTQQLHDLAFRRALMQAHKIISHNNIKAAINRTFGTEYYDAISMQWKRLVTCRDLGGVACDRQNNFERDPDELQKASQATKAA